MRRAARAAASILITAAMSIGAYLPAAASTANSDSYTASISGVATIATPAGPVPYTGVVHATNTVDGYAIGTRADATGAFTITTLNAGEYVLEFGRDATDAFSLWWPDAATEADAERIPVADGEALTGYDASLAPAGAFTGTVAPPTFTSYGSTEVRFWKIDDTGAAKLAGSTTGSWNGGFHSPRLDPGHYIVEGRATWYGPGGPVAPYYYPDAGSFAEAEIVTLEPLSIRDLGELSFSWFEPQTHRIAGPDRFAVSAAIARELFADGERAPVVYIANGFGFADAIAAAPAAAAGGGAILLVQPDTIPAAVRAELERLNPERIVVAGGPAVVSDRVMRELREFVDEPGDVVRRGGIDRYATADALVRDAFPGGVDGVFIATGRNYPDALSAAATAGAAGLPVVLVDGSATAVSDEVAGLIRDLGATWATVVGGPAAVSHGVEGHLATMLDGNVGRIDGPDRYAVSHILASQFYPETDFVVVATGTGFADALTGAPLAAALGAPLTLSPPSCLHAPVAGALPQWGADDVILLGGTGALAPAHDGLVACG